MRAFVWKQSPILIIFLILFIIILGLAALFRIKNSEPTMIGGQTDGHGCLIAAGYSWCDARRECERPWEHYCTTAEPKKVLFICENYKQINATFYPTDDKYVDLVLSDERVLSIPRAISASGARYAKDDELFVFWNKGDTAFITENSTTTFANCALFAE